MEISSYCLEVFDHPVTWGGAKLTKSDIIKIQLGDYVRICLTFNTGDWCKYYVQITQIIRYCYGGIHKPRKFKGKVVKIYNEFDEDMYPDSIKSLIWEGKEMYFQPKNIMEIPGWKGESAMTQPNQHKVVNWVKTMEKEQLKHEIEEDDRFQKEVKDYMEKLFQKYQGQLSKNKIRKIVGLNIRSQSKLHNWVIKKIEDEINQIMI